MSRYLVAFPISVLLFTASIPSAGQNFHVKEDAATSMEGRAMQTAAQAANPQNTPVIIVKPELTDEQMADLYMVRKDFREAIGLYKKMSDQNPANPVYLNKLGIAYHQETALSIAMKYYERATKADPLYADAQNNIGTIWYQRKKYGKAVRAYKKAISLNGEMAVLHSNLAYAYFGEKKMDDSIREFRQAISLDPQLFEHNSGRSGSVLQDRSVSDRGAFYFLLAKSYAEAGNYARCIVYLRKAKEEGYTAWGQVKTDPAFSAVLMAPEVQDVLAPKPRNEDH